ncbi:hypothetical protein KY362_01645 [Candidatus Woesearchaeota archaeon]|nr:hypothetical protein [Candidatus Woesearchaeota archaeon]
MDPRVKHTACAIILLFIILTVAATFFHTLDRSTTVYNELLNTDTRFKYAINTLCHYHHAREFSFVMYYLNKDPANLEDYERYTQKSFELYEKIISGAESQMIIDKHREQRQILQAIVVLERGMMNGTLSKESVEEEYTQLKDALEEREDLEKEYFELNVRDQLERGLRHAKAIRIVLAALTVITMIIIAFCVFMAWNKDPGRRRHR